jgi:transketolase
VVQNAKLRKSIVDMVVRSGEGHIPSSFSIVDLVATLYKSVLRIDKHNPDYPERDYFVLSKGHGSAALFAVLHDEGLLSNHDIESYSSWGGILGGHADATKVPFVEASTGSLGHGLPIATGIALGLKIKNKANRVFAIIGDGESQEGTTWEAALVAVNRGLNNLCVIVDWNESGMQLNPIDDLPAKWIAFGWDTRVIDGHNPQELIDALKDFTSDSAKTPTAIVAKTIKGYGVSFIEGHGAWHHKIPSESELQAIYKELQLG